MDRKYCLGTEENACFLQEMRESLLRFGVQFPAPDGSCYYLGDDGRPWKERTRDTYETARMTHVYAIGELLGFERGRELAAAGLKGLTEALYDSRHDGWFSSIDQNGRGIGDKQCYAHAFVILAASSATAIDLPGAGQLMEHALSVYDRYFWDEEKGLARDTWDTSFTVPDPYRGLNANMHSVEAFLAAADVLGDDTYRTRAGRIIRHVAAWAQENHYRTPEHYHEDWTPDLDCNKDRPDDPFKPYGATPGHGLEWARLIVQWAMSALTEDAQKDEQQQYLQIARQLYARACRDAWNSDGAPGFVYTTDWEGRPVVHERMHWVICEAVNTSACLYRLTGEERYAQDYAMYMAYIDEKVYDHQNGSFYHELDRQNRPSGTVWPGKPDLYHALQATLIPLYEPAVSICPAVKQQKCQAPLRKNEV